MTKQLNEDLINKISSRKNEPDWMRLLRLKCFRFFEKMKDPDLGVDLSGLNLDDINLYIKSDIKTVDNWSDIPAEIKKEFELLGISVTEQAELSGIGLQYDSELVYRDLSERFSNLGIVFMSLDEAIQDPNYSDLVKCHFMKLIKPQTYKYAALHGAVWSGGVFVYVPKNTSVALPIEAYYRFNAPQAGQFEHSIIIVDEGASLEFIEGCSAPKYNVANLHIGCVEFFVKKNAHLKYGSIVNWSKNMYNLTIKCLSADENANIEWISGVFGCKSSVLCPKIILKGKNASLDYYGITLADAGQDQNSGLRVDFKSDSCSAHILSKSISQNGGKNCFRSYIYGNNEIANCVSYANCESLLLDSVSNSVAVPNYSSCDGMEISHEAKVGCIDESKVSFLATRGIDETTAQKLIVRGFIDDISNELPFEHAHEMNRLIQQRV